MVKDQFTYYEQIDEYLSGEMSSNVQMTFERQIELDKDLKEEVSVQKDLRDLVIGASLQNVRSLMENDLETLSVKKNNKFKKPLMFLVTFISMATVGFISYNYLFEDKTEGIQTAKTSKQPELKKNDVQELSSNKIPISQKEILNNPSIVREKKRTVLEDGIKKNEEIIAPNDSVVEKDVTTVKVIDEKTSKESGEILLTNEDTEEILTNLEEKSSTIPLRFSGKLKAKKSEYGKQNGQLIIEGEVIGGIKPYVYLVNEEEFSDFENVSSLEIGMYNVKVMDATNETISLGDIEVEEEVCILDYNKLFTPLYGENWIVPVVDDMSFSFTVYSQKGVVYQRDFEIGEEAVWDGINNNGANSESGYYRFEILYTDGTRCFGELTIGN